MPADTYYNDNFLFIVKNSFLLMPRIVRGISFLFWRTDANALAAFKKQNAKLQSAARAEMRALFGKLNPLVDTSGSHVADKNKAKEDKAGVSLNARIQAFQAEHKLASFEEAAKSLFAQKPELFNAETDDDGGEAA